MNFTEIEAFFAQHDLDFVSVCSCLGGWQVGARHKTRTQSYMVHQAKTLDASFAKLVDQLEGRIPSAAAAEPDAGFFG